MPYKYYEQEKVFREMPTMEMPLRYAGKYLTDDIYAVINHPRTPKF